jgi:hypothetical protein
MADKQRDTLCTQTPEQIDCGLLGPEDFTVRKYDDPIVNPFHGQRGDPNSPAD